MAKSRNASLSLRPGGDVNTASVSWDGLFETSAT